MTQDAPEALVLGSRTARELARHASRAAPREACGLLVEDALGTVEVVVLENRATRPTLEFALDPGAVVLEHARAEARGARVVATWHTHPSGRAVPSPRDRALARDWPQLLHVVATPDGEVAAWRTAAPPRLTRALQPQRPVRAGATADAQNRPMA